VVYYCSVLANKYYIRVVFYIDVDFKMRTVLYGIHLLIDVHQIVGQHFISKGNGGEESKIAERQRESVCV
jgi:hypothetical protein